MNNLEELEKDIRDMQELVASLSSEVKELNHEVKEAIFNSLVNKSESDTTKEDKPETSDIN
jgi:hypothetical protein